mmetsp:Transcript_132287/g.197079  ORF Transcript_132287/g.197079 Transcript_132287/m.197079 type:complete len:105 (-) Transcript_132287:55-369(-)
MRTASWTNTHLMKEKKLCCQREIRLVNSWVTMDISEKDSTLADQEMALQALFPLLHQTLLLLERTLPTNQSFDISDSWQLRELSACNGFAAPMSPKISLPTCIW